MAMFNNLPQQTPYIPYYPRMGNEQVHIAPMFIKGRLVTSIDEAKASQIDLDGSLNVFPDLNNKRIYTKQVNLDGTVTFNVFELSSAPQVNGGQDSAYVTRNELEAILASFKENLTKPSAEQYPRTAINL